MHNIRGSQIHHHLNFIKSFKSILFRHLRNINNFYNVKFIFYKAFTVLLSIVLLMSFILNQGVLKLILILWFYNRYSNIWVFRRLFRCPQTLNFVYCAKCSTSKWRLYLLEHAPTYLFVMFIFYNLDFRGFYHIFIIFI